MNPDSQIWALFLPLLLMAIPIGISFIGASMLEMMKYSNRFGRTPARLFFGWIAAIGIVVYLIFGFTEGINAPMIPLSGKNEWEENFEYQHNKFLEDQAAQSANEFAERWRKFWGD